MTIIDQPNPIAQALSPIVYRVRVPFDMLVNYIQCDVWIWAGSKTIPPLAPTYTFTKVPNEQQEAIIDLSNTVKSRILAPPTSSYANDINLSTTEGVWIRAAFSWVSDSQIGIPSFSETIFATRGWTQYCDGINPIQSTHLGQNYPTPFGYLSTQLGYFAESLECIPDEVQQNLSYTQIGCVSSEAESVDLTPYGVKHGYAFNRINPAAISPFSMVRTFDFAVIDAEFEPNGHLDCQKIINFGSGSRVYISSWYDQFGDGGTDFKHLTGFLNEGVGPPNKLVSAPNLTLTNVGTYSIGTAHPDGFNYYEAAPATPRYLDFAQSQDSPVAENLWLACIVNARAPREFRIGFVDGIGGTVTFNIDTETAIDNRTNLGSLTDTSITLSALGNGYYQLRAQYHRTAGATASSMRIQMLAFGNALYAGLGSPIRIFSVYSVIVSTFRSEYFPPNVLPTDASSLIYDPAIGYLQGALSQAIGGMSNKTFNNLADGSYGLLALGFGVNNNGTGTHISARRVQQASLGISYSVNSMLQPVLGSSFTGLFVSRLTGAFAPNPDISDDALVMADYDVLQNTATIFNGETLVTGSNSTPVPFPSENETIRVNAGDGNVLTRVALIYDRSVNAADLWQAVYDSWEDIIIGGNPNELAVTTGFPNSGFLLTEANQKIQVYAGQPYTISVYPEFIRQLRITDDLGNVRVLDLAPFSGAVTTSEKLLHINVGPDWLSKYGLSPEHTYTVEGLNQNGLRTTYRYCFNIECEYRYKAFAVAFVNRYGVWDWFTFFLRSDWTQERMSAESFNNSLWPYGTNRRGRYYEAERGSMTIFNVNGTRTVSLNTNYLAESENERLRDIFMSERVVLIDREANCRYAVLIQDSSFTEKRHVNESLVQYTMTFKQAFKTINTSAV